jgi:hypothetical protein
MYLRSGRAPEKFAFPAKAGIHLINNSIGGTVDPGFRRECGFELVAISLKALWVGYQRR